QHLLCGRRQTLYSKEQRLTQRPRQLRATIGTNPRQQLFGEERIPFTARHDVVNDLPRECLSCDRSQLVLELGASERLEFEALRPPRPFEFRQKRPQRMAPVKL